MTFLLSVLKYLGCFPYSLVVKETLKDGEKNCKDCDAEGGDEGSEIQLRKSKVALMWTIILAIATFGTCIFSILKVEIDTKDTKNAIDSIVTVSLYFSIAFAQPYVALKHQSLYSVVKKMLDMRAFPDADRGGRGRNLQWIVREGVLRRGAPNTGHRAVWLHFWLLCLVLIFYLAISILTAIDHIKVTISLSRIPVTSVNAIVISIHFAIISAMFTFTLTHVACKTLALHIKE